MVKKLVLGVLIAFASFGGAVAASAGFEWWQNRGDTASRIVVAPVDATTPATTPATTTAVRALAEATTVEAEAVQVETPAENVARRVAEMAEAEQAAAEQAAAEQAAAEQAAAEQAAAVQAAQERAAAVQAAQEWAPQQAQQPVTTTTLHPQVQAQGLERVVAIIERHSDAWPWVVAALEVAQLSFFEDLPSVCDSAIGCYNHATGDIWLSLDALRERDTMSFSFFLDDHDPSDIVLHELAHAYTRSFSQGSDLLDLFGQHYAGCSGHGLDTDRLVAELLADTMAMAATRAGSSLPNDYGYFRHGGFSGCLVESSQPDMALFGAAYSTLFNCDSEHALDIFATHLNPFYGVDTTDGIALMDAMLRNLANTRTIYNAAEFVEIDAVLLTCWGIDCITPTHGCQNVTETDARRDAAIERLHERRCSDGLADWAIDRPGWEFGCEDFVPDDVECLVYENGREADPPYRDTVFLGLLDVSGECIEPDCTVEGPQGEPQPGYREYGGFGDCIAIDRPQSENNDTDG